MSRILMVTCGSLGDLNPYLAVAIALRGRSHQIVIATSANHRQAVESLGFEFVPLPPDLSPFEREPDFLRRGLNAKSGTEFLVRKIFMPHLEDTFSILREAALSVDLIVGHFLAFAVPLVAETLNKKWIQVSLQPISFFSRYDPPVLSGIPLSKMLRSLGPLPNSYVRTVLRLATARWTEPVFAMRRRLGLSTNVPNPITDSASSFGTMGWFPTALASPQPDWPAKVEVTGYPYFRDPDNVTSHGPDVAEFIYRERPLIFTLGSTARLLPGSFFRESVKAVMDIGESALLIGMDYEEVLARGAPSNKIMTIPSVPFHSVFPFARVVIHHGGIGTSAEAILAGKPMLVVPFGFDQPDNAERLNRLGVAEVLPPKQYRANGVSKLLTKLLADVNGVEAAKQLAAVTYDGSERACDFIERVIREDSQTPA